MRQHTRTDIPDSSAFILEEAQVAQDAADAIRHQSGIDRFEVAVTLGSGWKSVTSHLGITRSMIDASTVPGFRRSAVVGHTGHLTAVQMASGAHALVIGARTHIYEGHGIEAVVHGVRTAAALGVSTMVLTNGAGGLNPGWKVGEPVLIADHLNLTARSPLTGADFMDLTDLYSTRLRTIARAIDPTLAEGVYAQLPGPHYETPAEVRMLQRMGADMVGMSTTLEAIAARASGLEVLGFSLITNLATGIKTPPSTTRKSSTQEWPRSGGWVHSSRRYSAKSWLRMPRENPPSVVARHQRAPGSHARRLFAGHPSRRPIGLQRRPRLPSRPNGLAALS